MRAVSRLALALSLLAAAGLSPALAQDGPATPEGLPPAGLEDLDGPSPENGPGQVAPREDGPPSAAGPRSGSPAALPVPPKSTAAELDELFASLKREASAEEADKIAAEIQARWSRSGSETVDLLMGWAAQAMASERPAAAFDLLDQAIVLDPSYAEAWNRRATLNFAQSQFGRSIADIEQTLAREPRHFGALMGLGSILEDMDRKTDALDAYTRVLAVYPAMKTAQDAVGRLSEELGGQAI